MTTRELDIWIWEWLYGEKWDFDAGCIPFPYSSDAGEAFKVVEKMRESGYACAIFNCCIPKQWMCDFVLSENPEVSVERYGRGDHDSLPMAICLAAKKALEGEGE